MKGTETTLTICCAVQIAYIILSLLLVLVSPWLPFVLAFINLLVCGFSFSSALKKALKNDFSDEFNILYRDGYHALYLGEYGMNRFAFLNFAFSKVSTGSDDLKKIKMHLKLFYLLSLGILITPALVMFLFMRVFHF